MKFNEYLEPSVDVVEVVVETGFATTGGNGFDQGGDGDLPAGGEI